jgi:hypothetical protein
MPKATVRANARDMPEGNPPAFSRLRAVLGLTALTEMLAKHKAVRKDMWLLCSAGGEYEEQFAKAVQKSDRMVRKIAKMSCASDDEFFAKLKHIAKVEFEDFGYHEGQNYEGVVTAVRTYLKRRGST